MMNAWLKIGLLQPVIDSEKCWGENEPYRLNIFSYAAERVWQEIKEGLRMMLAGTDKPDIILIPELHLPPSRVADIKNISKAHNIMVIAGVDFQRHPLEKNKIRNRGIITIPDKWGNGVRSNRLSTLFFGKTYFTYMERSMFRNIEGEQCFEDPEKNMYVFQSEIFGRFGIMICSDIFDIERMMLYQGMIHHLFIISLNKDLNTYFAMTEALSRLLYCNIILCNTGYFGGSVAISPFSDPNERIIYKYQGQRMFNTNIISVPVASLDAAQKLDYSIPDKKNKLFKASPPGYHDKITQLKPGMPAT